MKAKQLRNANGWSIEHVHEARARLYQQWRKDEHTELPCDHVTASGKSRDMIGIHSRTYVTAVTGSCVFPSFKFPLSLPDTWGFIKLARSLQFNALKILQWLMLRFFASICLTATLVRLLFSTFICHWTDL